MSLKGFIDLAQSIGIVVLAVGAILLFTRLWRALAELEANRAGLRAGTAPGASRQPVDGPLSQSGRETTALPSRALFGPPIEARSLRF